jgi:hypothetical protein
MEFSSMNEIYVIGGQQRRLRSLLTGSQPWQGYDKGLILHIDPETNQHRACVRYESPPDVCADDDPEIVFQGSTLHDDLMYTCTPTEILIYRVPSFERLGYISLPHFNDVHFVDRTPDGTLLVANGGLDMVMELSMEGDILQIWNTLGEDPWGRFSKTVDYRKVASTKPHRSHPNCVFTVGDERWATRFEQKDAISLHDSSRRIALGDVRVHDGLVQGDHVYFTAVSGSVLIANLHTLKVDDVIDLSTMHDPDLLLGWTRGVLVDENKLWVGFSRIRPTKTRENVSWVLRGFRRSSPAHVACYDLLTRRCLIDIDVEAYGMSAVFSILPAIETNEHHT